MMRYVLSVLIGTLITVNVNAANAYREFKNQDGRTIIGRVVQYENAAERVQLELKNRKKAWVNLSDLSEADQDYIRNLGSSDADTQAKKGAKISKTTDQNLSREKIEEIAEQYVVAIRNEDFETINLILHQPLTYTNTFSPVVLEDIKLEKVKGNNIYVHSKSYVSGWLQFTQEGKIKYCPFYAKHPIEQAVVWCKSIGYKIELPERVASADAHRRGMKSWGLELEKLGVPSFGLSSIGWDTVLSKSEVRDMAEKLRDWILEKGPTFDNSEPEIYLPEKRFKEIKHELKATF